MQQRLPTLLPPGDLVEFLLEVGGEIIVNVLAEMVDEQVVHHHSHVLGDEALLVETGVLALHQRVHDARVGRRTADTVLFESLHEGRLGFEGGTFEVVYTQSADIAILPAPIAAIDLINQLAANSTRPLFLIFGIEFFQQVNGINYPLKNGNFNALALVKVLGL